MHPSNIVAIIPARGGSKGIPKKNLLPVDGQPLIRWSINKAKGCDALNGNIYVTSDDQEILDAAKEFGATPILRPHEISGDKATSESALLHALEEIESQKGQVDAIVFLQPTSPLRESKDIENALDKFQNEKLDSLFSASKLEDFFIWTESNNTLTSLNYDYKNRKRRQDVPSQYVENGSFYIVKPEILKSENNRLGGKIGLFLMDPWKITEIDSLEDKVLCEFYIKIKNLKIDE